MNIVISGCGKIGRTILEDLVSEGHDVIAIDTDPEIIEEVNNVYDIMAVCGNGADYATLEEAEIEKAELFISCTGSDELNMLSCLFARKMGANHTVARIRNPEYNDNSLGFMRHELHLSMAINPEQLTAQELFGMLKLPSATKIERFSARNFAMIEQRIKSGSALDGITLSEIRALYKSNVLICAVQRNNETFVPDGNVTLRAGDKISIAANFSEIQKLMRSVGAYQKKARNIMILGGSKTTFYLAKMLLAAGNAVKIIEKDLNKCQRLCEMLPKAVIIHGDGSDQELLQEEGIDSLDAFIALTGMDEENILISMVASMHKVPQVIAKVNSDELGIMAEKLGLDYLVSPKASASNVVVRYARALKNSAGSNMETLYRVMDGTAEALEFNVTEESKVTNRPLKEISFKSNVLIAAIFRKGKTIIPTGDDYILTGDRVIVLATKSHLNNLTDILK